MAHLRRGEELRGRVRTRSDARAATDARGAIHRGIRRVLRHQNRVRLGRAPRRRGDVTTRGDDLVQRAAVDDEILDDRERGRPKRLHRDHRAILETAHPQLARRGGELGAMRAPVDHHPARPADPLAAVALERDRHLTIDNEPLVESVEHLDERHVR